MPFDGVKEDIGVAILRELREAVAKATDYNQDDPRCCVLGQARKAGIGGSFFRYLGRYKRVIGYSYGVGSPRNQAEAIAMLDEAIAERIRAGHEYALENQDKIAGGGSPDNQA